MAVVTALAVLACGFALWMSRHPFGDFIAVLGAAYILLFLGVVWLILAPIGWLRYRAWRVTVVAPLAVIGTIPAIFFGVPSAVGFELSRGALDEAASECNESLEDTTIGILAVWSVERDGEACRFYTRGGAIVNFTGLANLPDGPPPQPADERRWLFHYYPVEGDWYAFMRRF